MQVGIQLFAVHHELERDADATIDALAKMGYTTIEPCRLYDVSPEKLKLWNKEYGIPLPSIHSGLENLCDEKFEARVKYLKELNCRFYVIPHAPVTTKSGLDVTINKINKYAPMLEAEGIELIYHNHPPDFLVNENGLIPHIEMQKHTNIRFQIDTYWIYRAGLNPLEIINGLGNRVAGIHLKDGNETVGTALGKGLVDIKGVAKFANQNNIPVTIENEWSNGAEMLEAQQSIAYLKSIFEV